MCNCMFGRLDCVPTCDPTREKGNFLYIQYLHHYKLRHGTVLLGTINTFPVYLHIYRLN